MKWLSNPSVEAWLNKNDVAWKLTEIPLSAIDKKQSGKNQSRLPVGNMESRLGKNGIIEDYAFSLAMKMEEGSPFFAIVVYKTGRSYVVIDGNHRVWAICEQSKPPTKITAYVVDCEDLISLNILTRTANSLNGIPLSRAELTEQAIQIYESSPNGSRVKIETMLGIPHGTLSHALRAKKVAKTLNLRNVPSHKLSQTTLTTLAPLAGNEPVLAAAASLLVRRPMSYADTRDFVKEIKRKTNETAKLRVVIEKDEELAKYKPHRSEGRKLLPSLLLVRHLRSAIQVLSQHKTLASLGFPSKWEIEHAREDWEHLTAAIKKVLG